MSAQVTVTGGTGFLGNNLVRRLLALEHEVTAIVRPGSDPRPFEGLNLRIIQGGLDDQSTLQSGLEGADFVIHAAAHIWFGRSQTALSRTVNVDLTRHIACQANKHNVRMIHVSSVDTLNAGNTPDCMYNETDWETQKSECDYTVTKREAEQVVLTELENGLDAVIVNPTFMIGPWDWKPSSGLMMTSVVKGFIPFAPGGGFCCVDVRNVADGIIAALERGQSGERYILGGQNMTYLELWQRFAAKVGKKMPRWGMSNAMARVVGFFGDIPYWLFRKEGQVNSVALKLSQLFNYYSSQKAIDQLGYEITDLQIAIDDAYDWFKEYGYL